MGILSELMHLIFGSPPMTSWDAQDALNARAAQAHERLDWKNSIVDLMKLLNMDSSFGARQELARELGYPGDVNHDSADMNTWLHAQVMKKFQADGYIDGRE